MLSQKRALVVLDHHLLLGEAIAEVLEGKPLSFSVMIRDYAQPASWEVLAGGFDLILLFAMYPLSILPQRLRKLRGKSDKIVLVLPAGARFPATHLLALAVEGVLATDISMTEFRTALANVLKGRKYLSSAVIAAFADPVQGSPFAALSPKEFDLLRLIAQGIENPAIAAALNVSSPTVYSYKARIYSKLGLRNDVQLLLMALQYGWLGDAGFPHMPNEREPRARL